MTLRCSIAVSIALVLAAAPAMADKLLVLQSEGRVNPATRKKIDAAIVKLAAAADREAAAGELNFTDAATAVGCKPESAACKDEVLAMLAVDEIVITAVAPRPGGIAITVRRFAKGGALREASMLLATGTSPDKLDGIAPLFAPTPAAPAAPVPATPGGPSPATPGAPAPAASSALAPGLPVPAEDRPAPEPRSDAPLGAAPTEITHEPAPPRLAAASEPAMPPPEEPPSAGRRRLEVVGMAGGAGLVVLGLAFWGAASGVQGEIDKAPTTTMQELAELRDLESKGDAYAGLGNLFTIGGLVVGGLATYFYLKDRRAGATLSARITPVVLDHGAGLVLTLGGVP